MDNIVEAIEKFYAEKNDQNFGAVMNLLLNAQFIAPANITPANGGELKMDANGHIIPEQNMQVALVNVTIKGEDGVGKNFLPLFSSDEEAKKGPDAQFIKIGLRQYSRVLNDDNLEGVLINPFGKRFFINKQLLGQVMESYKRSDSARAVSAVKAEFAKFDYVLKAYLLDAVNNETKQKNQIAAVDMASGTTKEQADAAFRAAHAAVQKTAPGYDLKYALLSADVNIRNAVKNAKPFYTKGEKPQNQVAISPAQPYPTAAVEAAKKVLADFDYVKEAYIVNMTTSADNTTVYLIIADMGEDIEKEKMDAAFGAVNQAVMNAGLDRSVQFALNNNAFTKKALENREPFYIRQEGSVNTEVVRTSDGKQYVFNPDAMDAVDEEFANQESESEPEAEPESESETPAAPEKDEKPENEKHKKGGFFGGLFGRK